MPDIVRSDLIAAMITIPNNFDWDGEGTLIGIRGGSIVTRRLTWTEGNPEQPDTFDAVADLTLRFFENGTTTEITSSSVSGWEYGDQNLSQIFYLSDFARDTTDDPPTGSVNINLDPSGLTATELTAMLDVDIYVEVSQPSASD